MTERFQTHLRESGLVPEGATVLLGYSGGADSTCLLHLLRDCGVDVVAAHLHHGQRPEADKEMELCVATCEGLGVPIVTGRADVPQIAADLGIGLEEAGRRARYEFFEQTSMRLGSDFVATAHTLDDRIETVILNLARGAGLHGLAGIQVRRGNIVRPLLDFSRRETRQYCVERGLWFHDDPANDELANARVRVRQCVIPELEAINSAARSNIERLAALADQEDKFLDGMAAAALEQAEHRLNGNLWFVSKDCEAAFHRGPLTSLPRVLLARSIRLVTSVMGGALDFHQTEIALEGLASSSKGSITAEGGQVVLEWTDQLVHVRTLATEPPFKDVMAVPGETRSPNLGWLLDVQPMKPQGFEREPTSLDVMVSAEAVKGQLYIRSYEVGLTMQPLGLGGTKKLSDVLSEMGLTEAAKRRLPIVCDLVGPIWVPGGPMADRVKVTHETKRCLSLAFRSI